MKNPLRKRYVREFLSDKGRYISLLLFLLLAIGFVSGFHVADGSMRRAYDESFDKYNIEDGHFTLSTSIPDEMVTSLEDEGLKVNDLLNKQFTMSNEHIVRIYKDRKDVNKICLMKGNMPSEDNEIVIDRLYADNNKLSIGDTLNIDNKDFRICGFIALSDYSALFKKSTDMMFDANKFTVACITDTAFDSLSDENTVYTYSWLYNNRNLTDKEKDAKLKTIGEKLFASGLALDIIDTENNQAIKFTGNDMNSDSAMVSTLLYILIVILGFIFGITTRNMIEKECGTIGTLRASGYTEAEMLRHYMVLPLITTLIGALGGNIMGYTFMKKIVVSMYYHSYSLPTYTTVWNGDAFVKTTVIPLILIAVIVFFVLLYSLKISPLSMIRHDLSSKGHKKVIHLKGMKFIPRVRLRVIFQNISSYITLFVGVLFAGILLVFGMMMTPLFDIYRDDVKVSKIADYQYILKTPVETQNKDAEKYCVYTLKTDRDDDVTVYGIQENSKYFKGQLHDGKILMSDSLKDKYSLRYNKEFTLKDSFTKKEYNFSCDGKFNYPPAISVFMTQHDFNKLFDKDENYYTGYFSNEELTDIPEMTVATKITQQDLTLLADQMDDSMGGIFWLISVFAMVIFILIIYLLAKQIIEKNLQSISMLKILGYNDKEISKIYNITTGIVMLISLVISLPLIRLSMGYIFKTMMFEFNGYLPFVIAGWIWPLYVALGMLCYIVVYFIQKKSTSKVQLSEALKNNE